MKTRNWTVSALTVLMLHLASHMTAAETRTVSAIERAADTYRKAVLAGDAPAVSATYRQEAVELPPNCPPLKGRMAIEEYYRKLFAGPMRITDFDFTYVETAASGDIGFTTGSYRQKLMLKSGEAIEDSGNFVVIVKRDARGWKSAYVIYNSDRPRATAGAGIQGFNSPYPAFLNYCSAVAAGWLFWLAWFAFGCIGFLLIVQLIRSLLGVNLKARHSQRQSVALT